MTDLQLRLPPHIAGEPLALRRHVASVLHIDPSRVTSVRILRRNVDARQRTIFINLSVRVYIDEQPSEQSFPQIVYHDVSHAKQVVVVGEGPGGLFAALRLIELGVKPIVIERGKDVHERKRDLAAIARTQDINGESNYCFGEGGAGAYSDGKLFTRSRKRGSVEKILRVFCRHGADGDILVDAHPHIGTDRLPKVIEAMRDTILSYGGEVHHQTLMTSLIINAGKVIGCETTGGAFLGPVILATGHSARDVYRYLSSSKIEIEAKSVAIGVRLEHPAQLINAIQYHWREGEDSSRHHYLPTAEYSFATQIDDRGVYSFCMCPGGYVIPAASAPEQIVVNGMSPSRRNTAWSNSGMVVQLNSDDVEGDDPLRMMLWQERIERQCWRRTKSQRAPAQRMADFVMGRESRDLPKTSYAPGLVPDNISAWMPPFIVRRLQKAFVLFGNKRHGFLTNEASVIAVETRTSAPVRIIRRLDTLQHIRLDGLFPCGEGAGYAGGIVSAAIDGERCAEMAAEFVSASSRE